MVKAGPVFSGSLKTGFVCKLPFLALQKVADPWRGSAFSGNLQLAASSIPNGPSVTLP